MRGLRWCGKEQQAQVSGMHKKRNVSILIGIETEASVPRSSPGLADGSPKQLSDSSTRMQSFSQNSIAARVVCNLAIQVNGVHQQCKTVPASI